MKTKSMQVCLWESTSVHWKGTLNHVQTNKQIAQELRFPSLLMTNFNPRRRTLRHRALRWYWSFANRCEGKPSLARKSPEFHSFQSIMSFLRMPSWRRIPERWIFAEGNVDVTDLHIAVTSSTSCVGVRPLSISFVPTCKITVVESDFGCVF